MLLHAVLLSALPCMAHWLLESMLLNVEVDGSRFLLCCCCCCSCISLCCYNQACF